MGVGGGRLKQQNRVVVGVSFVFLFPRASDLGAPWLLPTAFAAVVRGIRRICRCNVIR